MSDMKEPVTFTVHFEPKNTNEVVSDFLAEKEDYWWFPVQAGNDLWIFLNPAKVTKEQFFEKNPGFPPEHVHYVTQASYDQAIKDMLTGGFFKEGKALKVKGTITVSPSGPIEVSE